MNNKAELVFIPTPGVGHLGSTVELAKLLVQRHQRISITVLVMKLPSDSKVNTYLNSLSAGDRVKFIHLPSDEFQGSNPKSFFTSFIESHKPLVKEAVSKLVHSESASDGSPRLAGFVLDMFCACMADVADEFGVPSYIFFTPSAGFLGLMLHAQALYDEQNRQITELKDSDSELEVPSLINPFPTRVLPSPYRERDWSMILFELTRRFRRVKEQQFNAFEMVIELGLAVEIKMDYRKEFSGENQMIVKSREIEKGIKKLMEDDNEIRKKVKEMSEKSRKTILEGGSSFTSLGCFIDDVMSNLS
ncbi:hypothetical protein Pint_36650 [Pistacia integerrima]|uniref:Uncharacterized protein n=1 Tax=Pistacia integerrima TaxID=434235 RepID=A0ACC0Y434_9ROSI|nr:hypothetical protein Pint_36650 [Pistacia integerrima]